MPATTFHNRRAHSIENAKIRVTVLEEGGHIAEILDKPSGVNPLWIPPWPSIEPSRYDRAKNPEYGANSESKLLAGIMGHNLCLDIFGVPSDEEAAAGLSVHGEASVARYSIEEAGGMLRMRAQFPVAQFGFERQIRLLGGSVEVRETLENLSAADRPTAWTQHATLGPPFLEKGRTEFRASATRSRVIENDFSDGKGYMKIGADFDWPLVPRPAGGHADLRLYTDAPVSGGFTTHLMDPHRETAHFVAYSPTARIAFGYVWRRTDFPWLGIWEENYSRTFPPWNGKTLSRGMEFGASPFPETRRQMIQRGALFGVPGYRWIPAKTRVEVRYWAAIDRAERIPEALEWAGADDVRFT
jgi:hypothetical protein